MISRLIGLVTGDHHDHIATLRTVMDHRNQPRPMPAADVEKILRD